MRRARLTPWFPLSIVAPVWSLIALSGGLLVVGYLGLGVVMTHTPAGVVGPEAEYRCNWITLWTALIEQLLGFAVAAIIAVLALRHQRRGYRLSVPAVVLGLVSVGMVLIVGMIQLPLLPILRDALAL